MGQAVAGPCISLHQNCLSSMLSYHPPREPDKHTPPRRRARTNKANIDHVLSLPTGRYRCTVKKTKTISHASHVSYSAVLPSALVGISLFRRRIQPAKNAFVPNHSGRKSINMIREFCHLLLSACARRSLSDDYLVMIYDGRHLPKRKTRAHAPDPLGVESSTR